MIPSIALPALMMPAHHVLRRNAISNGAHQFQARIRRFHQAIGGECRRYEGQAGGGARGFDRVLDGVEHRAIQCRWPPLPGVTPPTTLVP
jgi:hypothetical protein